MMIPQIQQTNGAIGPGQGPAEPGPAEDDRRFGDLYDEKPAPDDPAAGQGGAPEIPPGGVVSAVAPGLLAIAAPAPDSASGSVPVGQAAAPDAGPQMLAPSLPGTGGTAPEPVLMDADPVPHLDQAPPPAVSTASNPPDDPARPTPPGSAPPAAAPAAAAALLQPLASLAAPAALALAGRSDAAGGPPAPNPPGRADPATRSGNRPQQPVSLPPNPVTIDGELVATGDSVDGETPVADTEIPQIGSAEQAIRLRLEPGEAFSGPPPPQSRSEITPAPQVSGLSPAMAPLSGPIPFGGPGEAAAASSAAAHRNIPVEALPMALLEHATRAAAGPLELTLNPAELGRLRFEMHHQGDQLRVVLSAEQPATLDLLRRHGEQLLSELRQSGYASTSMSFGNWGNGPSNPNPGQNPLPRIDPGDDPAMPPSRQAPASAGPMATGLAGPGLDLRF